MLRKILYIIIMLIPGAKISAQVRPFYDQYQLNGLAINPAYAGSQEALSIAIAARNQWIGFEGAPRTFTLSIHSPLRDNRANFGILAVNDKAGSKTETGILLNYAYRILLQNGKLSFGLAAGFNQINTDLEMLRYTDQGDALIVNPGTSAFLPEISFGMFYYTDRIFAGLSAPDLLNNYIYESSGKYRVRFNPAKSYLLLYSGYQFKLSDKYKFVPSMLINSDAFRRMQIDINCSIIYRDKVWLGTGYRTDKSMSFLLQYQANNQLRIAYSYGYELSDLSHYQKGTHEIMLLYNFKYQVDVRSPRYF
ncbi:MAG TPA: type IX secretion system membrane protein PorP/SprF [Bacteroidales bacterium]|nr:type IX secretion system membrane protein PorP/SprF [Bacteroidales bacterium]